MHKAIRLGTFVALTAVLAACAATRTMEETKVAAGTTPARKMLVVAVTPNPGLKRVFEDEFSTNLKAGGVNTVTSYEAIGTGTITATDVKNASARVGADTVMVARLLKSETVPDLTSGDIYGTDTRAMEDAMYPVATTEVRVYNASDASLKWRAVYKTQDPSNPERAAEEYAKQVTSAMKERNLF